MNKIRHNPTSTILGEVPLSEVLSNLITEVPGRRSTRETMVHEGRKYSIERMKVFAYHGCKCYNCGLEGTKVILTKDGGGGLHCDLYAERNGGFTLLNRDHILPASKGGQNNIWNLRPACAPCNQKRGNNVNEKDERHIRRRKVMGAIYRFLHTYRNKRRPYMRHEPAYFIASKIAAICP